MNEFYDQMLPRYAAKLGGKWGAKVEDIKIKTPGGNESVYAPEKSAGQIGEHMETLTATRRIVA